MKNTRGLIDMKNSTSLGVILSLIIAGHSYAQSTPHPLDSLLGNYQVVQCSSMVASNCDPNSLDQITGVKIAYDEKQVLRVIEIYPKGSNGLPLTEKQIQSPYYQETSGFETLGQTVLWKDTMREIGSSHFENVRMEFTPLPNFQIEFAYLRADEKGIFLNQNFVLQKNK